MSAGAVIADHVGGERAARPVVLVTAPGEGWGALAAAAALACAGAGGSRSPLLIDLGGRRPRPTLIAAAPAVVLEERLAAALPGAGVAARGCLCHLAVGADPAGLEGVSTALELAPGSPVTLHLESRMLDELMGSAAGRQISGALVLGEAGSGSVVPGLLARGLLVALLGSRPDWVCERRALFGALSAEDLEGFPAGLLSWIAPQAKAGACTTGGR